MFAQFANSAGVWQPQLWHCSAVMHPHSNPWQANARSERGAAMAGIGTPHIATRYASNVTPAVSRRPSERQVVCRGKAMVHHASRPRFRTGEIVCT